MNQDEPSWFVVHTKPRSEDRAAHSLHERAIHTFLPRLLVRRRHGSRRWQTLEPLFPGYLFARFQPRPEVVSGVRWARGVRQLLGDDAGPTPIDDDVVCYLQAREAGRGFIVPNQPFAPGMRVRFTHGAFEFLEGVIDRPASRADRVRVLLMLMNTAMVVEVDTSELERC